MARTQLLRHVALGVLLALASLCPGCRCWSPGGTADDPDYRAGLRCFLAGDHAGAAPRLKAFVAQYPSSPYASEAHYALGAMALRRGSAAEAEGHFNGCLASPRTKQLAEAAALGLARSHFLRGSYRHCREACLDILRRHPASPRADEVLFLVAEASGRLGDEAGARRYYRQVAERFPSSPRAAVARQRLGGPAAPQPVSPTTPIGDRYHVQVAALASSSKAASVAARLRAKGYRAQVVPVRSGGRRLHAVRVGPYGTKTAVGRAAAKLRASGYSALIKP